MNSSKFFILFVISFLSAALHNTDAQWVQITNGMGSIDVLALTVSDNKMFAGTNTPNGVYFTTNNGENWIQAGLNGQHVPVLTASGNILLAGTRYNGVFKTTNNGLNWVQTSLNNGSVGGFLVNGNNIFTSCWETGVGPTGVFLSTDGGNNWSPAGLSGSRIRALAKCGNYIFAAEYTSAGVLKTSNNGVNWYQTPLNNRAIWPLVSNNNNIYAGTVNATATGLFYSSDCGTSWIQTSLNYGGITSIAVDGNNIFAGSGSDNGIYASTDNCSSWIAWNEGLGNKTVRALCIFNNYIFAGTASYGVYKRPLSDLITSIRHESNTAPNDFSLYQNYPNPFNPSTAIKFSLPKSSFVKLTVYEVSGKEVQTLVKEKLKAGSYEKSFDASGLSSGVYYYKLTAGDYSEVKKMVLIK